MRTCPYCGKEAFGALRKATLGPARSARCQSCGRRVSVGPVALLAVIPFLAGIWAAWYLRSPIGIAALAVAAVLMFVIHEYAIPLVPRDD